MQIRRNYIQPLLVAPAAGASTGAAPTSAIVGRSGSAVPVFPCAVGLLVYSRTDVVIGSAIMLALCLIVAGHARGWMVAAAVTVGWDPDEQRMVRGRPVRLVGIGTSWHAAQHGA